VSALLFPLLTAGAPETATPPFSGPRICVDAQFWNIPGWQPREGDYAYASIAGIWNALPEVPATQRMLRTTSMSGMEPLLERLVRAEGFKLAALWYDFPESGLGHGGSIAVCRSGQALAHRYGMKFLVSASQNDASQAAEAIAGCADVLSVRSSDGEDTTAAIEQQRRLYQRILAANPRAILFQNVPTRAALLRQYRGNADLVRGM
jgi:hypothetical protein